MSLSKIKKFFGDVSGYNAMREASLREQLEEARIEKIKELNRRARLKMVGDAIMKYAATPEEIELEEAERNWIFSK